MKAKLIREIPQPEGMPYYFKQYEFECIECGRHYTRKRYDNRTVPYCGACERKHNKQKHGEQKAKREQAIIDAVLDKIRAEIDGYCSDNRDRNDGLYIAMKIIDKYRSDEE